MSDRSTISSEELCRLTGLSDRRHRQLASDGYYPPPINKQYQLVETLTGMVKYLREQNTKKNDELKQEQIGLTRSKRLNSDEDLALKRKQYVDVGLLMPALRNVAVNQKVVLQRVFEHEIAPNLAGLTTVEVIARHKKGVDEVCNEWKERVNDWLKAAAKDATKEPRE